MRMNRELAFKSMSLRLRVRVQGWNRVTFVKRLELGLNQVKFVKRVFELWIRPRAKVKVKFKLS